MAQNHIWSRLDHFLVSKGWESDFSFHLKSEFFALCLFFLLRRVGKKC